MRAVFIGRHGAGKKRFAMNAIRAGNGSVFFEG